MKSTKNESLVFQKRIIKQAHYCTEALKNGLLSENPLADFGWKSRELKMKKPAPLHKAQAYLGTKIALDKLYDLVLPRVAPLAYMTFSAKQGNSSKIYSGNNILQKPYTHEKDLRSTGDTQVNSYSLQETHYLNDALHYRGLR